MTLEHLPAWLAVAPTALLLLAVLYLPGTVTLLLLRSRFGVAVAGGPLLTAVLLGISGVGLRTVGLRYSALTLLLVTALLWGMAALMNRFLLARSAAPAPAARRLMLGSLSARLLTAAPPAIAGLIAVAALWAPVALLIDPTLPSPRVDPMYHYNVLNAMQTTGTASMVAAVDFNYGLRVAHVTYPTVWHAVAAAVAPLQGIVQTANALVYLVTPIVFVLNVIVLARVVFRRTSAAVMAAALAAGMFPAFPGGLVLVRAFWPNALAVSMLPGALVLLIVFLRRARWAFIRRHPVLFVLDALVLLAAMLGLGMTHPSVLFNLVLLALPLVLSAALTANRVLRRTLSRRAYRRVLTLVLILLAALLVVVLLPARVRSYLLRGGTQQFDDFVLKSVSMLANWPTDVTNRAGLLAAIVLVPLLVTGLLLLARRRERRWIVGAWAINAALIAGSYLPLPVLSGLSGLWYSDTYRLFAVQAAILPLAVGAVAEACFPWLRALMTRAMAVRPHRHRLAGAWAAGSMAAALAGSSVILLGAARPVGADPTEPRPVMTAQEYALLERLGEELPAGSVVIGDPASGVAYLPLESDVESVFTQVNLRDLDSDGRFLARRFRTIHSDPRVCAVLRHYGIQYFYEDSSMYYNYIDRRQATPGFYGVDTSTGFTRIDSAGDATLWRIDACGPIEPPTDWWERSWRRGTIIQDIEHLQWDRGPIPSRD